MKIPPSIGGDLPSGESLEIVALEGVSIEKPGSPARRLGETVESSAVVVPRRGDRVVCFSP